MSAIVPAYNEGPRIRAVLDVLVGHPALSEVIVVDDGSTDGTAAAAAHFDVRLVTHPYNLGKGASLESGVSASDAPIFFFCDADLVGLTPTFVEDVVRPVSSGRVDMFIGARASKTRHLLGFSYAPLLDGQRALTRDLWDAVPHRYKRRFEIEAALNAIARSSFSYDSGEFDISHVRKEEKWGSGGRRARYDMYMDVASVYLQTLRGGTRAYA